MLEAAEGAATPFRVLTTLSWFEPGFRGGGPVRSVAHLLDTLPPGFEVDLISSDRDYRSRVPYPGLSGRWVQRGRARIFYLNLGSPLQLARLIRELHRQRFDILYLNGVFSPWFTILPILAAWTGLLRVRQLVIAPRGELSPGALSLKSFKKRIFLAGWLPLLRSANTIWHAFTDLEASEIKALVPWAEIHQNSQQVSLPDEPLVPVMGGDVARLIFVSRITPKKNLDVLLSALHNLRHPVRLDIFGPVDDDAYWSRCRSLMCDLPAGVQVSYGGALAPHAVRVAFAESDAFVFPTRGENFGHVIAESLSASCPVLCSPATSWSALLSAGGGAVLPDLTVASVARAIDWVAAMTPAERLIWRRAVGDVYRRWRAAATGPHLFEELRDAVRSN